MRFSIAFSALALAFSPAHAAPPSPVTLTRYNSLWNDSPFTTKPVIEGPVVLNPFEDYALGGVTPLDGGDYLVTLLNKKKPEERVSIPGNTLGFKVIEVHKGTKGPLSTTVMISNGVKSGLVGFDEKLLVLKAPVAAKPQPGQPGQAPNGQPLQPGQTANNGQPVPTPQIQPPNSVSPTTGVRPGMPNTPGIPNGQSTTGGGRPPRPRVVPVPPTTTR